MTLFPAITSSEPMQASKWLTAQVLLNTDEMSALLTVLEPSFLFCTSRVCHKEDAQITREQFLLLYSKYVEALKDGHLLPEMDTRHTFAGALTGTLDTLYATSTGKDSYIIRVAKPVVQLQPHRMKYSSADGKFRSMTYGPDSITWGIQFSYPQLYHDPSTCEVHQVKDESLFPNTVLFQQLQRWVRHHTTPVPFIVNDQKINVPIRLGKNCFSWINNHPQLRAQGIKVQEREKG